MEQARERSAVSLVKRVVRWIGDFERAMDMLPVDYLELRVAHLERGMTLLRDGASDSGASSKLRTQTAREG